MSHVAAQLQGKMMTFLSQNIAGIKQALNLYKKDREGTATIEFVLIAPLLIFLYIGLYEVSIAYTVNGAVNRSTEVMASFPTFEETLNEQQIANVMTASAAVLNYATFDLDNLAIKFYSIEQVTDEASSRRLVGRAVFQGAEAADILPDQTAADFQDNLSSIQAGDGFVVASIAYRYEPAISTRYVETVVLSDQKILNPRENQGRALVITAQNGDQRADLSCRTDGNDSLLFTCD